MPRPTGALSRIALGCFLAVLPGCGGGGGGSPTGPTTLPPVTAVVAQGTFHLTDAPTAALGGQICDAFVLVPFTTTATGTLEVTVDWSHSTNNLDIGIERGTCSTCDALLAGKCVDFAGSDSATAKPETLSISSVPAGTYTLGVGNVGPGREAGSYQVLLTH